MNFKVKDRSRTIITLDDLVSEIKPQVNSEPFIYSSSCSVNAVEWVQRNLPKVRHRFETHGAVLFRGFSTLSQSSFEKIIKLLDESKIDIHIGDQDIVDEYASPHIDVQFHHEYADRFEYPKNIFYYCEYTKNSELGQTPIVDGALLYQDLNKLVYEVFKDGTYFIHRQFGNGLSKSWQEYFGCNEKYIVDRICKIWGYSPIWNEDGTLEIIRELELIRECSFTQLKCWSNLIAFFHHKNFKIGNSNYHEDFHYSELPSIVKHSNGKIVDDKTISEINKCYQERSYIFNWKNGDILMLNNHRYAHARKAYSEKQVILIGV